METHDRPLTFDQIYIHAETDSRRIAVLAAKGNALWQAKYPNSLPTIEFLDSFIKEAVDKEVKTGRLTEHRVIESEIIKKHMNTMSNDVMVDNQTIERKLKMESL
jgi:hypothetical protein